MERGRGGRGGRGGDAKGGRSSGSRGTGVGGAAKSGNFGTYGTGYGAGKSGGSGGPKKKSTSVMRESTWNNMSKGQRLKDHGTTSYAKYKAGKKSVNITGTSKTNIQMRGRR